MHANIVNNMIRKDDLTRNICMNTGRKSLPCEHCYQSLSKIG